LGQAWDRQTDILTDRQLKGSVKELSNYETEKVTRKASVAAEYIELFGSPAQDCHARFI